MNIAYKGKFLRDGLMANGHRIYDICVKDGENLADALKALAIPIDLVVWELFGGFSDINSISMCSPPVAAYCIDTPLNEFWLNPCLKNMDYVFVDQPQSVPALARYGIEATWLPLPTREAWFQPDRAKKFDITFVGTIGAGRAKRSNLLNLLRSKFKINIMAGLDIPTTQKVFSESKTIINENFFPGLTMRVLKGLSAGTIVFTEQSPYGETFDLVDHRDLVYYNAYNVLDRLDELLSHYRRFSGIGEQGREKCRELYASAHVAAALLSSVMTAGMRKKNLDEETWLWNQTVSQLLFFQRFGGNFTRQMKRLVDIADSSSERAAEAHRLIGDIRARFRGGRGAEEHYRAALAICPESIAGLKLALLHIRRNETDKALKLILSWIRNSPGSYQGKISDAPGSGNNMAQGLLTVIGEIFFFLGSQWDMGFRKDFADPVPDTAFEIVRMAWKLAPSSRALDLMARCLRPQHLQGELLPFMVEGIKLGTLGKCQMLEAAKTAFEYYDRETASSIMAAIKSR